VARGSVVAGSGFFGGGDGDGGNMSMTPQSVSRDGGDRV
jgi:hypothetical protein